MRFSKSFWMASSALLAASALISIAGVASSQQFFDNDDIVDPDSPGYDGSEGEVDGSGNGFYSYVEFSCLDSDNNFTIGCETWHPDNVSLSKNKGKVDQTKRNNDAIAYMSASELNGDPVMIDTELSCDKVQLKSKSNIQNNRMQIMCNLRKCDIPGALTLDQIDAAIECASDKSNVGRRVSNIRAKNQQMNGTIKTRGVRD